MECKKRRSCKKNLFGRIKMEIIVFIIELINFIVCGLVIAAGFVIVPYCVFNALIYLYNQIRLLFCKARGVIKHG